MKTLLILNDPPYGTERWYNALRLAGELLNKEPESAITVFPEADAVLAAKADQKTPTATTAWNACSSGYSSEKSECSCAAPAWTPADLPARR